MSNRYTTQFIKKFSRVKKLINRHEESISLIVNGFLKNPQMDKAYWRRVNVSLNKEYKAIKDLTDTWSKTQLPRQYRWVVREQMAKAKRLGSVTRDSRLNVSQLLRSNVSTSIQQVLAQSAIANITSGLLQGRNDLNKLITATRQTLISESVINKALMTGIEEGNIALNKILSRQGTVANSLLKANEDKRYIKIIDKNGNPRRYRISYYSEMVYRSSWHEAQSRAVKSVNANYATDLVRVSNHNTTTEICQQYEGKVFSLTGRNKDFPILDQSPPFHVNCLHYLNTTFKESLKVQGVYDDYSKFSKGEINTPPGQTGFVPVTERNKITARTITKTKESPTYKKATPKQKRNILRTNISKAIGNAA
jgi:hypothetical protein